MCYPTLDTFKKGCVRLPDRDQVQAATIDFERE